MSQEIMSQDNEELSLYQTISTKGEPTEIFQTKRNTILPSRFLVTALLQPTGFKEGVHHRGSI
ncbi:hypothetical protein M0644_01290 [Thermosynechococcus sp. B1]|uniref:hypothetical protein n=1 Tax=Thermosynechococcus sp. B1 TaxID=2937792 RepID=UPI002577780F|nr:hypothetical protein [Thermosynechococcus sp. B1]WJI26852.1 hypothetical protein M0644_01290 [Thermosynechococcus sp. B1]